MSKEKGILLTGKMVKALLEGRKTMTRRVIKPQPEKGGICFDSRLTGKQYTPKRTWRKGWFDESAKEYRPKYQVGDTLYVKEAWRLRGSHTDSSSAVEVSVNIAHYEGIIQRVIKWNDDMYGKLRLPKDMPKEFARIWLEVVEVRVERVQDISFEDAQAEGMLFHSKQHGINFWKPYPEHDTVYVSARAAFYYLWDFINKKKGFGWKVNPFVWVYTFKVLSTTGRPV